MKISLLQYDPEWEDKEKNKDKIIKLLDEEYSKSDLLILPEMTLTGFTMNSELLSEEKNGSSFSFFSSIARERKTDLFCGLIESEGSDYFNVLYHIGPEGESKAMYRKIHPFSYADEDKHYTGGDRPVTTMINRYSIGLTICYDLRFPELYRMYGKQKCDILVNIANWPVQRIKHWNLLLKARAVENLAFMIGVNRIGKDKKAEYNGFSSIIDPAGEPLISIENDEGIFSYDINPAEAKETRDRFRFLDDIKLI